jgi:uncharacterized protein (UPF0297 family)
MGFFDTVKYSQEEHPLTELEVRKHINTVYIPAFHGSEKQERLVQDAILARRHSDGKISLEQVYDLLTVMKNRNEITKYDRDDVMRALVKLYASKGKA